MGPAGKRSFIGAETFDAKLPLITPVSLSEVWSIANELSDWSTSRRMRVSKHNGSGSNPVGADADDMQRINLACAAPGHTIRID